MKKKMCLFMALLSILYSSCELGDHSYEYKILRLTSDFGPMMEDYMPSEFPDPTPSINQMAKEGWTLDHVSIQKSERPFPIFPQTNCM